MLSPHVKPQGEELQKLRERVRRLETTDAERYEGTEPLDAVTVYHELLEDYETHMLQVLSL